MTIAGLHDFVKVSNAAEFKSFLLIMCIDAPGSTTKSLSSGLIVDGAGRLLFYVSPLIFGYFWPASTLLHGHIALAIPCLPETDPQNLEDWGYAEEDYVGNRTHRIGFSMFELFRKIDEDFGGSKS